MPTEPQHLVFEGDPLRLDHFLSGHWPTLSRSYLHALIEKSGVRVNGRLAKKGQVLRPGDRIDVDAFLLPQERRILQNPGLPFVVVFESPDYFVVDKPPGMPTHPNEFNDVSTLANAALARDPKIATVGEDPLRPGIVHRLDTDTSGLIVVARTAKGFAHFRGLFDRREMKKTYVALVLGDVLRAGRIDRAVAHHPKNPRKMMVVEPGKAHRSQPREASTEYEPAERFNGMTLLRVRTLTGRMHQVRVHLASIGHPLCGDALYQEGKHRPLDRAGLSRHFLHACELRFVDPSGAERSFVSALPEDLEGALLRLRGISRESAGSGGDRPR